MTDGKAQVKVIVRVGSREITGYLCELGETELGEGTEPGLAGGLLCPERVSFCVCPRRTEGRRGSRRGGRFGRVRRFAGNAWKSNMRKGGYRQAGPGF